jgi:hypothetical protein
MLFLPFLIFVTVYFLALIVVPISLFLLYRRLRNRSPYFSRFVLMLIVADLFLLLISTISWIAGTDFMGGRDFIGYKIFGI